MCACEQTFDRSIVTFSFIHFEYFIQLISIFSNFCELHCSTLKTGRKNLVEFLDWFLFSAQFNSIQSLPFKFTLFKSLPFGHFHHKILNNFFLGCEFELIVIFDIVCVYLAVFQFITLFILSLSRSASHSLILTLSRSRLPKEEIHMQSSKQVYMSCEFLCVSFFID